MPRYCELRLWIMMMMYASERRRDRRDASRVGWRGESDAFTVWRWPSKSATLRLDRILAADILCERQSPFAFFINDRNILHRLPYTLIQQTFSLAVYEALSAVHFALDSLRFIFFSHFLYSPRFFAPFSSRNYNFIWCFAAPADTINAICFFRVKPMMQIENAESERKKHCVRPPSQWMRCNLMDTTKWIYWT